MRFERYESRFEAGIVLSRFLEKMNQDLALSIKQNPDNSFCFCIPNGGVPVAEGLCSQFNIKYDLLIVRKVKIPYNTEAGFGSVTTDGSVLLNDYLLPHLNLNQESINRSIEITKEEIRDRLKFYNFPENLKNRYAHINGKSLFLTDDGLASGFTMLAAIRMLKKYHPERIYVVVPTASNRAEQLIKKEVDGLFCPHIPNTWSFAVANAYKHWYDVPEKEVKEIIEKSGYYIREY